MADLTEDKVLSCLRRNINGCSITEIVSKTNLSRSAVRIALARLSGGEKIIHKNVGIAKVYFLGENNK